MGAAEAERTLLVVNGIGASLDAKSLAITTP
jgi:hypothetical protein